MSIFYTKCPDCSSAEIQIKYKYPTKNHGSRIMYECEMCGCMFSETKGTLLENMKKPISLIWQAINNRTEGMSFNATARVCGISKNTLIDWERKFTGVYQSLFLYSLTHCFLQLVIEGDEFYTKIKKTFQPMNLQVGPLY